jgi:5-methylcytosine-specific restriction protein A
VATYLVAWNPAIWNWPELARDIRQLARRGHLDTRWSCGRHRHIEVGSRAFLVRLGVPPKGIFGAGVTLTEPAAGTHWIEAKAAAGIPTNYTTLRLERLYAAPLILVDELLAAPPFRRFRWGVRSSGTHLPEPIADALEDLWEARVVAAASASPAMSSRPDTTGARPAATNSRGVATRRRAKV